MEIAQNIKHVFVLMLENHSFDNMLAMSGIQGLIAATTANSNTYNGTVYPVLRGAPDSMPTDPGHEFPDVLEQLAGTNATYPPGGPYPPIGNSGFAANYATTTDEDTGLPTPGEIGDVMACFETSTQLPVLYQLATNFAVCDQWFSSMPGPTWSNRYFVHGASANGLDHMPTNWDILKWSVAGFAFPKGSIYDSLNTKNLDWCVYQDYNGPIEGSIPQVLSIKNVHVWDVGDLANFAGELTQDYPYAYTFIEPNYGSVSDDTYHEGTSQHPMDSVIGGENLIANVYEAIRNSPLWNNSLLIITYDEHGGFYDSVSPGPMPAPNDGSSNELNQSGFAFNVAGVRVPAVVISPWIPAGTVDHTVYDHSSVLATLERRFHLDPLTDRDKNAKDVLHLLSLLAPRPDCPTKLKRPTAAVAAARPVVTAARRAALDLQPLPASGNLIGFLGIAHKAELELAEGQPELRAAAATQFKTIQTRGQARAYMQLVHQKMAAARARRK